MTLEHHLAGDTIDPPKRSFTILSVSRAELYCHELERRQNSDGPEINHSSIERSDTIESIDAQLCRPGSRTVNKHLRDQFSLVSRGFLPSPQQIKLRQYLVLEGTRHLQGQMPSIATQIFLEVGLKPT